MTKDDIIRMAKEAGLYTKCEVHSAVPFDQLLTSFAALIAAAEREACASLCFQMWDKWMDSRVGNESHDNANIPDAEDCAAAIRARGQHE